MLIDYAEQKRVQAPPLNLEFQSRHDDHDADNWRLVERDLSEDPDLWPLPSQIEAAL